MDARVPAADGGWPRSDATDPLEARLEAIERRLEVLEQTVSEELRIASDEMRRGVTDLGRLLLRDLERLSKVLADHRDAIVDRVTAVVAPPARPPAPDSAGADAAEADGGEPATDGAPDEPGGSTRGQGDDRRWRAPGRRKGQRSQKAGGGGDTPGG